MPKEVTVVIPDFSKIADEELAGYAYGLDGRWSNEVKNLLKRFDVGKLDLNSGWANTDPNWSCPCCGRAKAEIARVTSKQVLRCKLEHHHDHLIDRARRIFDVENPSNPNAGEYNRQRNIAKEAVVDLVARFESTLICGDCNTAEGKIKNGLTGVDRYFTFSPHEIASCLLISPNRAHELDLPKAQLVWEAVKPDFLDRLDFVRRMAARFSAGKNRQQVVTSAPVRPFEDASFFRRQIADGAPELLHKSLSQQLLERSVCTDGEGTFTTGKKGKRQLPPTATEFAEIERLVPAGKEIWQGLGSSWRCAVCERSKLEICRKSNRGEWMARIHRIDEWIAEDRVDALQWRRSASSSDFIIGSHIARYVCQDCKIIFGNARRKVTDFSDFSLTLQDLARVLVRVEPNCNHDVDYDLAAELSVSNAPLVSSVSDYELHKSTCYDARYRFRQFTEFRKYSRSEALAAIGDELGHLYNADDAERCAEWLVDEGNRFADIRAKEKASLSASS